MSYIAEGQGKRGCIDMLLWIVDELGSIKHRSVAYVRAVEFACTQSRVCAFTCTRARMCASVYAYAACLRRVFVCVYARACSHVLQSAC